MKNFLVHTDDIKSDMLNAIGKSSIEDLFCQIPQKARMAEFNLDDAISEMETQKKVKKLAGTNKTDYISFLGAGTYNKFVPACIGQVASRFEFLNYVRISNNDLPFDRYGYIQCNNVRCGKCLC